MLRGSGELFRISMGSNPIAIPSKFAIVKGAGYLV